MVKHFAQVAGLTLLFGMVFVPAAHADTHFSVHIGPYASSAPVAVVPGRAPRYWQPGRDVWNGSRYQWVPGARVRGPYAPQYSAPEGWQHDHDRDRDRHDWDRDRRG